ncbi:MAG TPA: porphobilinogen synthase [Armatimonadota bacterium]
MFPTTRPRRLRRTENLRRLVRETRLSAADLIYPLFVMPGSNVRREIPSLPGCFHLSPDQAAAEGRRLADLGLPGVLLFGLPESKDESGSEAWAETGVVPQAIRSLKRAAPDLLVLTDVCLCEYTSHGHCGLLDSRGEVDNDATLPLLARVAVSHAAAGADLVAPSDMMDGRVAALRSALDAAGHAQVGLMSYTAKYASAFYGPFREAADCAPQSGDRRGYQMDPANRREARREAAEDTAEGADILMVKPALAYLDILRDLAETSDLPLAAYNVSGEYAMVKAAAARGWLDERRVVLEILTSLRRAGADIIITYHAPDALGWLAESPPC